MKTPFTDLVGCELPLQLAPMGAIGTAELALAVAQAGGLGMVPHGVRPPACAAGPGRVGAAFLMPFVTDADQVRQAARGARVVELFYGWPDPDLVSAAHSLGALACWQVGSVEEAVAAQQAGCELIAVQGVEAGGHVRGTLSLRELLPAVLREVDAVVIAGGGLGDAADVAELMALGAHAVRVGTRFIPCAESAAHPGYVAALAAAADGEDTVLTGHFDEGWPDAPHRVLRIAEQAARQSGNRSVLPPTRGVAGDVAGRAMYAGCGVGAVKGPTDALTVVRELMRGVA